MTKRVISVAAIATVMTVLSASLLFDVYAQPGAAGSFTDTRDGKKYRTVKIGNLTWMAENLNYKTGTSVCYDNKGRNCQKYGRLYNWDDAMTACPAPWRVPSDKDWDSLALAAGGQRVEHKDGNYTWKFAGKKLKSTTGWYDCDCEDDNHIPISGNGTDDFGFSALPGGIGVGGSFYNAGDNGYWWSATEYGTNSAWGRGIYYFYDHVLRNFEIKTKLYSVRCVRDFAAPQ